MAEQCSILPARVEGLTVTMGAQAVLHDVSLRLGARGCTVIMGPNGAGKSMLLRVLHGLVAPTKGRVDWAGRTPQEVQRAQAMVFQKPVLLRRTARANIAFILRARGMDPRGADAALDRVGLGHKAATHARHLSGGEAQRLALARALATGPEVLFLDEPSANLDPAATAMIEAILGDARDVGTRIILVTHDIGQARRMADDVVFLTNGRIGEHRPAGDFFSMPVSKAARAFLAGELIPSG